MSEVKPEAAKETAQATAREELGGLQKIEQCRRAYWQKEKRAKKVVWIFVVIYAVFALPLILMLGSLFTPITTGESTEMTDESAEMTDESAEMIDESVETADEFAGSEQSTDIDLADEFEEELSGNALASKVFDWVFEIVAVIMSVTMIAALVGVVVDIKYIIPLVVCREERAAYQSAYRKFFVVKTLRRILRQCVYNHSGGLPKAEVDGMKMLNLGDEVKMEDLITGNYKGVEFRQADIEVRKIYERSKGKGFRNKNEIRVILKGRYIIFDIKKDFTYRLALVGKSFKNLELKNRDKYKQFNKIEVESKDLHKRFRLYAEDGFEAFYILDPAFIARLEALGERYRNRVGVFFDRGKMHVVIADGSDAFEIPPIETKINEQAELKKVEADIKLLTDLVDDLKVK